MPAPNLIPQAGYNIDGGAGYTISTGAALTLNQWVSGVDGYGRQMVSTEGTKPTYSVASTGTLTLPATPTQVVVLMGSSTKTVRVLSVRVSGSAATASQAIVVGLQKLSTAPTGGTSTTPAISPHDSASAAATAVLSQYTVLPTLGTGVGYIRSRNTMFGLITAATIDEAVFDFTTRNGQGVVLRGTAQGLAINLNGVALSNATIMSYAFEWTEEG